MIGSAAFSGALAPVSARICRRSLAYLIAPWKLASPLHSPCIPVPSRAWFIMVNMQLRPLFASPIKKPLAPSKFSTQVAEALIPILCSMEPQCTALRSPGIGMELGHDKQRDAFGARRRVRQLGQHQVDDVGAQVVLTGRDEDLAAGDRIAAIRLGHGAGLDQAQVGAAVGFGQAHGAGPFASGEFAQVGGFLLRAAMGVDRRHRAVRSAPGTCPRRCCWSRSFR